MLLNMLTIAFDTDIINDDRIEFECKEVCSVKENMGLCLGCMNKLDDDGKCRFCNYVYDPNGQMKSYLAPGTVLDDRYMVGKILTVNGEGASYIGYDKVTNEKVVVREYFPDTLCKRAEDSDKIIVNSDCLAKYKTFMSEFAEVYKILSRMRNLSHIVPALDMFVQNNTTYAILEYVEGVSLRKFLQENSGILSWEQVRKLFPPIFTTLSLIHNAGIIHRGICPENILITVKGEIKLIGFCISSMRTQNTELNAELYSGYAAPEQYNSLEWQGTWTDVYAISAVLYRMLTGTVPPEAHGRTIKDTIIEPIRLNTRIPLHVSRVIMHGLELKGENRIQTITELVTQLFEEPQQYIEHHKGATQTIPIKKPTPDRKSVKVQKKSEEKINKMLPSIIGLSVVAVVMIIAVILIFQIFFAEGGDTPQNNSSRPTTSYSGSITTTGPVTSYVQNQTSNEITSSESDLGTGAVMPNIVGQMYESVRYTLENDFTIEVVYDYSDEISPGEIMDQSIAPDTLYNPEYKNKLVLTVCQGSANAIIPDYANMSQQDYINILESLKIKYVVVKVYSDTVEEGYVVTVDKNPGTTISIKDGEVLTVSVSASIQSDISDNDSNSDSNSSDGSSSQED